MPGASLSTWMLVPSLSLLGDALPADGNPGRITPSRTELEIALTVSRFDDGCLGPGPDDACPPINTQRVFVRRVNCAPWRGPPEDGKPAARLVRCRYLAAAGAYSSKRSRLRWLRETALLKWEGYRDLCFEGESKRGGYCGSSWTVESLILE